MRMGMFVKGSTVREATFISINMPTPHSCWSESVSGASNLVKEGGSQDQIIDDLPKSLEVVRDDRARGMRLVVPHGAVAEAPGSRQLGIEPEQALGAPADVRQPLDVRGVVVVARVADEDD